MFSRRYVCEVLSVYFERSQHEYSSRGYMYLDNIRNYLQDKFGSFPEKLHNAVIAHFVTQENVSTKDAKMFMEELFDGTVDPHLDWFIKVRLHFYT